MTKGTLFLFALLPASLRVSLSTDFPLFARVGTFCKTKIAIFVKARGRGAKKWRMFANIHTKVRVDSLLREQNFLFEIGLS